MHPIRIRRVYGPLSFYCFLTRKKSIFNKVIWSFNPDKDNKSPAPFPIQLPLNCILACTDENDVVYDPFMGSGTTALACNQTNRRYIGSEIGDCEGSKTRLKLVK